MRGMVIQPPTSPSAGIGGAGRALLCGRVVVVVPGRPVDLAVVGTGPTVSFSALYCWSSRWKVFLRFS